MHFLASFLDDYRSQAPKKDQAALDRFAAFVSESLEQDPIVAYHAPTGELVRRSMKRIRLPIPTVGMSFQAPPVAQLGPVDTGRPTAWPAAVGLVPRSQG